MSASALGQLYDSYKVFVSTNKSTFLFVKCQPNTRISKLQAEIARTHQAQYPEHGRVSCKRLLTSLKFENKQSYAVPGGYSMSDLSFTAHNFGDSQCIFEMQAELTDGQAELQLEGSPGAHNSNIAELQQPHPSQPLLALPASPAQPDPVVQLAGLPQPAASASLSAHAAADAVQQEQAAEHKPKKKHKKRKQKAEAAPEDDAEALQTQQAGSADKQGDVSGSEQILEKKKKRRKKSTGAAEHEVADHIVVDQQTSAKKKKKKKKKDKKQIDHSVDDMNAAAEMPTAQEAPLASAPDQLDENTAAAAADADEDAEPMVVADADVDAAALTSGKKKKKKKKKKKGQHTAAADTDAGDDAGTAGAEATATGPTEDDELAEVSPAADLAPAGIAEDDSAVPDASKKKKKKKKKKRKLSAMQDQDDDAGPSQAEAAQRQAGAQAAEAVAALAAQENALQTYSCRADEGLPTAAASGAAAPAASDTSHGKSAHGSNRHKKKDRKSLAEAAAAYGMLLPAELAGRDAKTGDLVAAAVEQAAELAQAEQEEQAEPGWKKRRRELLPELDAVKDTQDLDAQAGPSNAPAAPESSALQAYHAIADDLTRYMAEHGKAQETLKSDPDMAGSSRPAAGKSANSRSSSNADALALMPTIPAPTSGLVSPDDASLQQQPGYGESSSTSDSDSESSEEEEDEQAAAAAPQEEEEVQGPEVPNHAMADPDGEEDQAAVSSSSSSVSSSSSDEEAVEQQPAHEGDQANGVAEPAHADDSSSDDSSSDSDADFPPGGIQDDLTQPDLPDNGHNAVMANGNGGAGQHDAADSHSSNSAEHAQLTQNLPQHREDESSSGDSDVSDESEDERPPDLLNAASGTRQRANATAQENEYNHMGIQALLEAAAKENGLESARGLEVEEAEEGDKRRRNKRQPLVNPMEAAVAHRGSKEGTQTTGQKKRGRPAKGSFTVTEDSDLLDQVAKRPVQDWGPAIKQASVLKRAVKAWLNEDRVSRGLKEVHSNVYQQNAAPEWWPLPQWDSSQIERKAPCQQVYAALQKYMRENRQHQGNAE